MSKVNVQGLTEGEVLAALFNNAKPQGLGLTQYDPKHKMGSFEGDIILTQGKDIDYLDGRVIKTKIDSTGEIDATLYDRDNGEGAAAGAIYGALDKKKGGVFSELKLPYMLMGSVVENGTYRGIPAYVYKNIMGGTFYVYVDGRTDRRIWFAYWHPSYPNGSLSYVPLASFMKYETLLKENLIRLVSDTMQRMIPD